MLGTVVLDAPTLAQLTMNFTEGSLFSTTTKTRASVFYTIDLAFPALAETFGVFLTL